MAINGERLGFQIKVTLMCKNFDERPCLCGELGMMDLIGLMGGWASIIHGQVNFRSPLLELGDDLDLWHHHGEVQIVAIKSSMLVIGVQVV